MKLIQAALIFVATAGLALSACDSKPKSDPAPVAVEEGATAMEAAAEKVEGAVAKAEVAAEKVEGAVAKAEAVVENVEAAAVAKVQAGAETVANVVKDAPACAGGAGDCPFHDEKGHPKGHDHAGHDHAGHDHAGHDHAGHDHKGHDHAGHDHAGHDHAGHDHAGHGHDKGDADLGCGAHAETVAKTVNADGTHFGAAFTVADASPLGTTLGAASADEESLVRVSGNIHKVCQKKGCWLIVKDGDAEARVIMKGYAFTVPLDSTGKPVVVEGNLKVKVFTEAQAKHLAEDGGEDPATVTGEKREYLLTATAISIGNKG